MAELKTNVFLLSFFLSLSLVFPIDTGQGFKGNRGMAKTWASVPGQAKDESKQGSEQGIVPVLPQSEKSRSRRKLQV